MNDVELEHSWLQYCSVYGKDARVPGAYGIHCDGEYRLTSWAVVQMADTLPKHCDFKMLADDYMRFVDKLLKSKLDADCVNVIMKYILKRNLKPF
jgi:hypothetical protein